MSRTVAFVAYGDPLPKGSAKAFMPKGWTRPIITSTTKGLKRWESQIAAAAQAQTDGELMTGPVLVTIAFYLSRPKSLPKKTVHHAKRPDLDKLIRGATDALTGIVWRDDSQAVSISATKAYTETLGEGPRAEFQIVEVAQ